MNRSQSTILVWKLKLSLYTFKGQAWKLKCGDFLLNSRSEQKSEGKNDKKWKIHFSANSYEPKSETWGINY